MMSQGNLTAQPSVQTPPVQTEGGTQKTEGTVKISLQDHFLNALRYAHIPITAFLMNGFQMRGTIIAFDKYTVVLESDGKQQLIYKHAISTLIPLRPIQLD